MNNQQIASSSPHSSPPRQKETKRETRQSLHKKNQGHSQFIRSKFDIDYNPKLRVFHIDKNSADQSSTKKRSRQKQQIHQLSSLVHKTQQQIKRGKKIIIDWNQNTNFRTTRFPSLEQPFRTKRSHTQEANFSKHYKNSIYANSMIKIQNKDSKQKRQNKQIFTKSQHLQQLINQSIEAKNIKNLKLSKIKKKKSFYSSEAKQASDLINKRSSTLFDPHYNYTIIEEVEQKQKQFFKKNKKQIMKAINYEAKMSMPISQNKVSFRQKKKFQQIHERIICKSKLTLLKSDLAKRFKQIRENVFQLK